FLAVGLLSFGVAACSTRLRDPGIGAWEAAHDGHGGHEATTRSATAEPGDVELGFFEIVRRVMLIPTVRRVLVSFAVLGMLLAPFLTYLAFFLQERWGLGPAERAAFMALSSLFGVA